MLQSNPLARPFDPTQLHKFPCITRHKSWHLCCVAQLASTRSIYLINVVHAIYRRPDAAAQSMFCREGMAERKRNKIERAREQRRQGRLYYMNVKACSDCLAVAQIYITIFSDPGSDFKNIMPGAKKSIVLQRRLFRKVEMLDTSRPWCLSREKGFLLSTGQTWGTLAIPRIFSKLSLV